MANFEITNCVIFTGCLVRKLLSKSAQNCKDSCVSSPEIANVPVYLYFCPTGGGGRGQAGTSGTGEPRVISRENRAAAGP